MRIRHLGLINAYQQLWSEGVEGYPPVVAGDSVSPVLMSDAALMLWLWRVASWRVVGNLSWTGDYIPDADILPIPPGSGAFDITMPSDGPLFYEAQRIVSGARIEKNLLHRQYFNATTGTVAGGTGDFSDVYFDMELASGISKYNNGWEPKFVYNFIAAGSLRLFNRSLEGSMDGDGLITITFDGSENLTGAITIEPDTYYPYALDDGTEPIWEAATGAQLMDPRQED